MNRSSRRRRHRTPSRRTSVEIILALVVFGLLYLAVKKWVVPSFEKTFADRTDRHRGRSEGGRDQAGRGRRQAGRAREAARRRPPRGGAHPRGGARAGCGDRRGDARAGADRGRRASSSTRTPRSRPSASRRSPRCGPRSARWPPTLAGRIVGESLDDEARQSRVVDRFLADLETEPTQRGQLIADRGPLMQGASSESLARADREPRHRGRGRRRRRRRSGTTSSGSPTVLRREPGLRRRGDRRLGRRPRRRPACCAASSASTVDQASADLVAAGRGASLGRERATWPTRSSTSASSRSCWAADADGRGRPSSRTSCSRFEPDGRRRTPSLRDALSDPARSGRRQARRCCRTCSTARPPRRTVRLAEQAVVGHAPHRGRRARRLPARSPPSTASGSSRPSGWRATCRRRDAQRLQRRPGRGSTTARCTSTSSSTPTSSAACASTIGDDVIDGTVASRLDDARRRLAG